MVTTVANAPARPSVDQYKPLSQIQTIDDALKNSNIIDRFKQAVPRHLSTERMLRVCAMAVYKTPDLKKCEMMSLLGAMLSLASLGLEPNTPLGQAYLIPFKARRKNPQSKQWEEYFQVQIVIGYRGYIELARRSGSLTAIHADVVYEGDEFTFEYGTNMHLRHVPMGDRSKPLWAYAHASLSDGQAFEVLPYEQVLKIRDNSQGYKAAVNSKLDAQANGAGSEWKLKAFESNPWVAFEHEMASKTMIRRLSKMLPMSIEFMRAAELDGLSEAGNIQYSTVIEKPESLEDFSGAVEIPQPDAGQPETVGAEAQQPAKDAAKAKVSPKVDPKPEPEKTATAEPEIEPYCVIDADGGPLYYDDPADYPAAYLEEMTRAHKEQGIPGLNGFVETNADNLAHFETVDPDSAKRLRKTHAELAVSKTAPAGEQGKFM